MRGTCLDNTCSIEYIDKNCKCYSNISPDVNLAKMSSKEKTDYINSNQYCAYEDDGFLYPCDPACCTLKCPGECPGVEPRPPESLRFDIGVTKDVPFRPIVELWLIVTLCLILLSLLLKAA